MIVKAVTLFLVAMLVLGMFGKFRLPRLKGRKTKAVKKCNTCGGFIIGAGPCSCRSKK